MKQQIKNGIIFGLTTGIVFTLFGVVYAAWNDIVSNGDTVSASSWNTLVGKISDMDSVVSFSGSSIQVEEICDETGANCQDTSDYGVDSIKGLSIQGNVNTSTWGAFSVSTVLENTLLSSDPSISQITIQEAGSYLINGTQYTCFSGSANYAQVRISVNGVPMRHAVSYPNSCDSATADLFQILSVGDTVSVECIHNSGVSTDCYGQIVKLGG